MPEQGLLSTLESLSAPHGALAVFAPFISDSSKLGRILWAQKNPKRVLGAFWGWRSEADLYVSEIKFSYLACYRLFFAETCAFDAQKGGFWLILWKLLWRSVSTNVGTILLCFGFVLPPVSIQRSTAHLCAHLHTSWSTIQVCYRVAAP